MAELRWECHTCLTDWPEPFCDTCSASLVDSPLLPDVERFTVEQRCGDRAVQAAVNVWGEHHPFTENVRQTAARRLLDRAPGYEDGGEFSRRVDPRPDEQRMVDSLWEANHHDMQRMK